MNRHVEQLLLLYEEENGLLHSSSDDDEISSDEEDHQTPLPPPLSAPLPPPPLPPPLPPLPPPLPRFDSPAIQDAYTTVVNVACTSIVPFAIATHKPSAQLVRTAACAVFKAVASIDDFFILKTPLRLPPADCLSTTTSSTHDFIDDTPLVTMVNLSVSVAVWCAEAAVAAFHGRNKPIETHDGVHIDAFWKCMQQLARSGETNEQSDMFQLQKTARMMLRRTQDGKHASRSTVDGINNAFKTTILHFTISDAVRIVLHAGCFGARRFL